MNKEGEYALKAIRLRTEYPERSLDIDIRHSIQYA